MRHQLRGYHRRVGVYGATVATSARRRPSTRCTHRAALCAGVRHHMARRLRGRGTAGQFHTREHGGRSLPEELHLLSIREPQALRPERGFSQDVDCDQDWMHGRIYIARACALRARRRLRCHERAERQPRSARASALLFRSSGDRNPSNVQLTAALTPLSSLLWTLHS